ncbi:MAG: beta-propeller fold lactonase family protein [Microbacterium sp.]|nr:beta-propeller fold lactonase family protein [Microbacterium sp.]
MRFWTGGYTADMEGAAAGIGTLLAGEAGDPLAGGPLRFGGDVVRVEGSPAWIAAHPVRDVLYAALEGAGAVQAFAQTGEARFVPLGAPVPVGDLACHVAVAPDGGSLIASCWGDGHVVHVTLDAAGAPSSAVTAVAATDPYGDASAGAAPLPALGAAAAALREAAGAEFAHLVPDHDRETAPTPDAGSAASSPGGEAAEPRVSRAHQAAYLPDGVVATTDMGLDLVRFWRAGSAGLRPLQEVVLPRGSGPRHLRRHPSGHLYVITELSHEVFVLAPDAAGSWTVVGGAPLSADVRPDDTAAELALSRDGGFLYGGIRGSNTIATLRVRGDGSILEPVALVEAGVDWPRHHVVARDTLLVAGERSNDVASLTLDERTGVPRGIRHRTEVPSPTCLLPAR